MRGTAQSPFPLRRFLAATAAVICLGLLAGCDPGAAPAPPAPVGCGTMSARVTGQTNYNTTVTTTATMQEQTGSTITVTTPPGGSGYELDGVTASGSLTGAGASRRFTAKVNNGDYTISFQGTITGPPAPCTGRGTWTMVLRETGQSVAKGSWSVP